MTETNTEINIPDAEIKVKKHKGRSRNIPGEYASKLPKDKEHFKKYYQASNLSEVIACELCTRTITRQKLKLHQKSSRCKPIFKLELVELPEIL